MSNMSGGMSAYARYRRLQSINFVDGPRSKLSIWAIGLSSVDRPLA